MPNNKPPMPTKPSNEDALVDLTQLGDDVLDAQINALHQEAERLVLAGVGNAVECGRRLIEKQRRIHHGNADPDGGGWTKYVEDHYDFGIRQAQRYMRAAREYDQLLRHDPENATRASHLSLRGLLELAARNARTLGMVPESRRAEVLDEVERRDITNSDTIAAIAAARRIATPSPPATRSPTDEEIEAENERVRRLEVERRRAERARNKEAQANGAVGPPEILPLGEEPYDINLTTVGRALLTQDLEDLEAVTQRLIEHMTAMLGAAHPLTGIAHSMPQILGVLSRALDTQR